MPCVKPISSKTEQGWISRCLNWPFFAAIVFYQRALSPPMRAVRTVLGMPKGSCRFYPCCSEYARQAFQRKSFLTALALTIRRLAKCHPFNPGGYDPLDASPYETKTRRRGHPASTDAPDHGDA